MGFFERLFEVTPPDRREALKRAVERTGPNSFDPAEGAAGRYYASRRRIEVRNVDTLIGMCQMAIGDGAIDNAEARTLLSWIENNLNAVHQWPGSMLYERIARALVDGHIDPEEERDLLEAVAAVAGCAAGDGAPPVSGAIPYDDPCPPIIHDGRVFAVTGQFVFGPRKTVVAEIQGRGGIVKPNCSKKLSYLIVGTVGSEEWLHSTHGTKIIRAVELKQQGEPLAIVREQAWVEALN
jgi:hypothetical protein